MSFATLRLSGDDGAMKLGAGLMTASVWHLQADIRPYFSDYHDTMMSCRDMARAGP